MPWENTEQHIRSGHRDSTEFQKDTLKTITLNEEQGIKAIVGKPKGKHTMEVQSYLFEKDKGWTVEKAKAWFEKHHNPAKEHVYAVLPFAIAEKIMEKPLRIRGLAMTREETAFLSAPSDAKGHIQPSQTSASVKSSGGPQTSSQSNQPEPSTNSLPSSTR